MNEQWIARQNATPEARRGYEQERLVLWTTDKIYGAMEDAGMTKADLARELGTSRAYVTALLSGSRNMTLRTVSDLAFVLRHRITLNLEPLREGEFMASPVQVVRSLRPRVVHEANHNEANVPSFGDAYNEGVGIPDETLAA